MEESINNLNGTLTTIGSIAAIFFTLSQIFKIWLEKQKHDYEMGKLKHQDKIEKHDRMLTLYGDLLNAIKAVMPSNLPLENKIALHGKLLDSFGKERFRLSPELRKHCDKIENKISYLIFCEQIESNNERGPNGLITKYTIDLEKEVHLSKGIENETRLFNYFEAEMKKHDNILV